MKRGPVKIQADWICRTFTSDRMIAAGVLMIDISVLFLLYMPFSGEKLGVYLMSFLALLFAGVICVAEAAKAQKDDERRDGSGNGSANNP